jgi:uncharacterized membrane protein
MDKILPILAGVAISLLPGGLIVVGVYLVFTSRKRKNQTDKQMDTRDLRSEQEAEAS